VEPRFFRGAGNAHGGWGEEARGGCGVESGYGLLEEVLWRDEWALLLACILLNQTHRRQAHRLTRTTTATRQPHATRHTPGPTRTPQACQAQAARAGAGARGRLDLPSA
jgi:hypothetical protein